MSAKGEPCEMTCRGVCTKVVVNVVNILKYQKSCFDLIWCHYKAIIYLILIPEKFPISTYNCEIDNSYK